MKKATDKQIELIKKLASRTPPDKVAEIFKQAGFSKDGDWSELTIKQANYIIRRLKGGRRWGSF